MLTESERELIAIGAMTAVAVAVALGAVCMVVCALVGG